jgi:hypothetical protein
VRRFLQDEPDGFHLLLLVFVLFFELEHGAAYSDDPASYRRWSDRI